MSLATRLAALANAAATESKALRTLINGNAPSLTALTTTAKTNLVAAINEINAKPTGPTTLDGLSDVVVTAPAVGHILYHDGTDWDNVLGSTYYQPRNSNLDSLAGQASTAFGRGLLNLADSAALTGQVATGTTAAAGKLALATNAETQTGTDTTKATTSAGTKAAIDQRIVNDATLASNSTVNAPSIASVKSYADALIGAANAVVFKGVIDASANPNYPAANAGDLYRISVAGKIGGASGPNVEVGDILLALADGTAAGTHATVGTSWNITQVNLDGAVIGPAASVSGNLPSFSGTGGKTLADSGFAPSNAALSNSAVLLPSQAQVQAWAQQKDATLTALAGLTTAANQVIMATGVDTFSMLPTGAVGRNILADATAADVRTEIDVYSKTEIGDPEQDLVALFTAALV